MSNRSTRSILRAEPEAQQFMEESGADLHYYWHIVRRRKWSIVVLVMTAGLVSFLWANSREPIYRSTATLLVGGYQPVMASDSAKEQELASRDTFLGTQVELLRSRQVTRRTLARLREDNPDFNPIAGQHGSRWHWLKWVPTGLLPETLAKDEAATELNLDALLLRWLSNGLYVEPVGDTSMVKVSFDSPDPRLAAEVANAAAAAYIQTHLAARLESTKEASQWLKAQLEKSQKAIDESMAALQRYREQVGLFADEGAQTTYDEQLRALTFQLSEARRARIEAQDLYRRANQMQDSGKVQSLSVVLQNPRIQALRDREQELERQIRLDSARFQGTYPGLAKTQEELRAVRDQREQALAQIVAGLRTSYEMALGNEKRLEEEVQTQQTELQERSLIEAKAAALEQVVATKRQAHSAFLRRFMDVNTQHEDTVSQVATIVDRAVTPEIPYEPNKRRIVIVSVLLGFMGGVGRAFLLAKLDKTFEDFQEVEHRLGIAVLGELPELPRNSMKNKDSNSTTLGKLYLTAPNSIFSEGIQTVRSQLVLSDKDKVKQVLVVTSTTGGEGKTTVALNLALALGQLRNVLLIDADLRQPSLARVWGFEHDRSGLAELTAGTAKVAECVHEVEGGIHLLPAGKALPQDPLKTLASKRFAEVLRKTAQAYDTVVVDSAPVGLIGDTIVLAAQASHVLYVIRANSTDYRAVEHALKKLEQASVPLLGVVLNGLDPKETIYKDRRAG